ncbi:amidase [Bordetella genomosp. 8]|uniref:Amidase n=1 Tax=Bordetella genomosp. 8 TaxID=1416806 RepID=A0A1W6YR65_9BORD|nr:amidase [Bordetella genomosp. 8]ARP83073.1 amidase [Bordetella genomosp. 8]
MSKPTGDKRPGNEIVDLSAIELSAAIHRRAVSCIEVMAAYLSQIDRINPRVNAIVGRMDAEQALRVAADADAELAKGRSRGWMHGFPQAPKDTASVAGMVSTRGSRIYRDAVTQVDGLAISRMRAAGSIFIGRTNAPEFGLGSHTYNAVYGATGNAYDPSRCAGGSSGGAAVALATHMLPVADGGDMMGSLRNPAGYNNVFGMRPSFGRVPGAPADDVFFDQLSTSGPMARSVAELSMLLSIQAGADPRAPFSIRQDPSVFTQPLHRDCQGLRIGWLGDFDGYLATEPGVLDLCERALGTLRDIGCSVEAARVDFAMDRLWKAWTTLRSYQIAGERRQDYDHAAHRDLLKPEMIWEVESGRALSAADVYDATVARSAWFQQFTRLFDTYDFLVLPTAQVFPFDIASDWPHSIDGRTMDTYHRWMEVVIPVSMAGVPALNVPAGFSATGLPMGLQLIGPPLGDMAVLQLGHAYEQACPHVRVGSPLLDQ